MVISMNEAEGIAENKVKLKVTKNNSKTSSSSSTKSHRLSLLEKSEIQRAVKKYPILPIMEDSDEKYSHVMHLVDIQMVLPLFHQ